MTEIAIRRGSAPLAPAAVFGGVLALSAAAWLVLAARMAGMDAGPGGDPGPGQPDQPVPARTVKAAQ